MCPSFTRKISATPACRVVTGRGPNRGRWTKLAVFFESLGPRYLKSHQVLTLDVLNVDLAGKIEWWRRDFYDTRILRDVYPPRFTLNYRLSEDGRTLAENKETVVDPNYLANPGIYFSPIDPLRFEKAMLEDLVPKAVWWSTIQRKSPLSVSDDP